MGQRNLTPSPGPYRFFRKEIMSTTRFIDRIMAGLPVEFPKWMTILSEEGYSAQLRDMLRDTTVFDITNVADYFYTGGRNWKLGEFTNLAPPFSNFWMEMQRPADAAGSADPNRKPNQDPWPSSAIHKTRAKTAGVLFQCREKTDMQERYTDHAEVVRSNVGDKEYEDIRWICQAQIYMEWGNECVLGPCGVWHYNITKDFRVHKVEPQHYTEDTDAILVWKEAIDSLKPILWACFLAQWLLHCNNVRSVECDPAKFQPKIARAYLKRRKRPMLTFKRLVIDPMKKSIRAAGKEESNEAADVARAMSVIRGHTKTYGPDKPLFGKYVGTWFWAGHDAGQDKEHKVQKDYKVKGRPNDNSTTGPDV
jgi:hypothetical protein